MMPRVGIVYVPFRNKRHFEDVVASWRALVYPKDRLTIYIVPNIDPEGLMSEIEGMERDWRALGLPEVRVLADGINHGFAGNHNLGIRAALEDGCVYVYLNNGDLKLDSQAIDEVVKVAESNSNAASVQSLMLHWHQPDTINVLGGVFHVAGYGYAGGNLLKRSEVSAQDVREIGYASAGAALYRASALREVGLLEEGFFMYHEDLEFGLRLRTAGYTNLTALRSVAYHDYKFATNAGLFEWTEMYRYVVTLAYWRPLTLFLISPILLGVELAAWVFALRGGWFLPKLRAARGLLMPRTWKLILSMRMRMKRLRRVRDRALFAFVSGRIEAQEQSNWIVERIANPILSAYVAFLRKIIIW